MKAFYFLSLLACVCAAPQFYQNYNSGGIRDRYFDDDVFDTRAFWADLADEMHRMDEMLQEFTKQFPTSRANEGFDHNNYIVTLSLAGFDEKDIVVKARKGLLMIQAVHKYEDGNQKSYMDLRTLPSHIDVAGSWTYDKGVLKIVFGLTKKTESESGTSETELVTESNTEAPKVEDHSREEMGHKDDDKDIDADVGLQYQNKDREILTNIIPSNSIEATTYAVDLKNEIDFVPVKY